jgi:hypothetical protein
MILAYLLLLTGLTISAVAIYYSVVGLTAIFSAAAIPIIIMGSALEVGKLVCASWLKANWERAPRFMKYYMTIAVVVLMLITSMGIFGFLSKAHNDQTLVSGDVGSKIAIYDEKIKTTKENIEADRKQLKQMDEAVDQVMGRSTDEKGADKANSIRKSQQRDRIALAKDIETQQKLIASLNDEAAPIRAEVRKVEAEVGPIKYIAAFIYGTAPDESMLERAVTWIIILIVIVFDPLAVIMLLAAQMTFSWKKENEEEPLEEIHVVSTQADEILKQGVTNSDPVDNTPLTTDFEGVRIPGGEWVQTGPEFEVAKKEPEIEYQFIEEFHEEDFSPVTADSTQQIEEVEPPMPIEQWNTMIAEAEKAAEESAMADRLAKGETYIDGAGVETVLEPVYSEEDGSKKKTYMIKDPTGQIQVKNRD